MILVNSQKPYKEETLALCEELKQKYQAGVLSVTVKQLRRMMLTRIMEKILYEFPCVQMEFFIPKWVEILPTDHYLKAELLDCIRELMGKMRYVKDAARDKMVLKSKFVRNLVPEVLDSVHWKGEDPGGYG